jgi:hypothetical protein
MFLRALLWVGLYVVATLCMLGVGGWLVIAPRRAGEFLNERYAVVPLPSSLARRVGLRVVGAGLVSFGVYYAVRILWPLLRLLFPRR